MNDTIPLEAAAFLACLPYRKTFYQRGGLRAAPSPLAPDWDEFLHSNFSVVEIRKAKTDAEHARARCAERDCSWITWWDVGYPPLLREIFDPPSVLFYSGPWPELSRMPAEAVVGTRQPVPIAREAARNYVESLAAHYGSEVAIVSGFARGIDSVAHLAAIDCNLPGVAVLGAGLFHAGPASNLMIPRTAAERGVPFTLMSEFVPWEPARAYHFPRRNRIIAGLCAGLAVMQAPAKSGALISAGFALDEGRDVRAFDHPLIPDALNAGCRALLLDGAMPIDLSARFADLVKEPPFGSTGRLPFLEDRRMGRIREALPGIYMRVR